jgi:hypothetical protein
MRPMFLLIRQLMGCFLKQLTWLLNTVRLKAAEGAENVEGYTVSNSNNLNRNLCPVFNKAGLTGSYPRKLGFLCVWLSINTV